MERNSAQRSRKIKMTTASLAEGIIGRKTISAMYFGTFFNLISRTYFIYERSSLKYTPAP